MNTQPAQFDQWRDRAMAEIAEEFAQLREQDPSFWRALRDTAMAHARVHREPFDAAAAVADARRANRCLIRAVSQQRAEQLPLRRCQDCVLDLGEPLRALGSCPRWGQSRNRVVSRCPAFEPKR